MSLEENGKPSADVVLEVVLTIEHLRWARRMQAGWWALARSIRVRCSPTTACVDYDPAGVAGVIGPPAPRPSNSAVSLALAAGNTAALKAIEFAPAVSRW